ncbi:MAG: DNA ligase D [Dehalococcoidia bacterium]|jgi:bifunctional non-homologous end joining protein LigD
MPRTKPALGLDEYARKRSLKRSAEPPPERKPGGAGPLRFVVHKHAASRLHYDLRLEAEGVLKSWAVPKGPSLDPKEKRLAVMVEDHPADYADFEGVIPDGEYGAGEVIVWDRGSYAPEEDGHRAFDRREAEQLVVRGLEEGKLSVYLNGEKLKGSWALVKSRRGPKDWLLIKHQNGASDRDILREGQSVVSGMTIEDLKAGGRPEPPSARRNGPEGPESLPGARKAPFPRALAPMLATLAEQPFSHPDWIFEPKLDGLRAVTFLHDGKVRLVSRRGRDDTKGYPLLAAELTEQPARDVVLDGEIVAPDEQGRPSFQRLQQRMNLQNDVEIRRADAQVPVLYYVFDILYLDGYDLTNVPFEARRRLLERTVASGDRVRLIEQFQEDGETAYQVAIDHGLEGVMAKKRDSAYLPGQRSRLWLKVKATLSDEFVIGGYTRGTGARARTFGSLLLGQYDGNGKLRYVGNVGSGFDDRLLDDLLARLDKLHTTRSPFAGEVDRTRENVWVKPDLVAEVKFAQWTGDGKLRAPVFLRLREDKPKEQVARVEVVGAPSGGKTGDAPASAEASVDQRDVDAVLDQISAAKRDFTLKVQGHQIALNNLDKPFWPRLGKQRGLTKRDLLVYLTKASPYLLPHLKDRPITLKRYPNGIDAESFFQKHYENGAPPYVEKVLLFSEQEGDQEYLLCNNLPTLLWLGQIADIELHTWYSRTNPEPDAAHLTTNFSGSLDNILGSALNYPDFIVFDLDPYLYSGEEKEGAEPELNRKAFAKTREVAGWLREVLTSLSLPAFVKTSGRTGLHVYVPIVRRFTFDEVRAAAGSIGRYLMQQHPNDITMEWSVAKRKGKVFFDHNQNSRGKTLASAYSPRPSPEASVSVPLLWEELPHVYPTDFTILNVADRLAQTGDPWQGILLAKHDLSALLSKGPEAAAR